MKNLFLILAVGIACLTILVPLVSSNKCYVCRHLKLFLLKLAASGVECYVLLAYFRRRTWLFCLQILLSFWWKIDSTIVFLNVAVFSPVFSPTSVKIFENIDHTIVARWGLFLNSSPGSKFSLRGWSWPIKAKTFSENWQFVNKQFILKSVLKNIPFLSVGFKSAMSVIIKKIIWPKTWKNWRFQLKLLFR
jgi:hypothetical protein